MSFHLQESLFDEGLRIAQQYGMADFAEEIKGLIKHETTERSTDANHNNENSEKIYPNESEKEDSNSRDSHAFRDSQECSSSGKKATAIDNTCALSVKSDVENDQVEHTADQSGVKVINTVPAAEQVSSSQPCADKGPHNEELPVS